MPATVQSLAAKLAAAFETRNRANGDEFACLREGSPEWMTAVIQAAHGDMFPDDWRYRAIWNLANRMADSEDLDDARGEAVDSEIDVYNSSLIEWLGSHGSRTSYCDDAASEFGFDPKDGIIKLIQLGQYAELNEVLGLMVLALEEAAENEPGDWVAGWNLPGYMPDSEPAEFATAQEARDYIAEEMRRYADDDTADEYADSETEGERVANMLREAADECDALEGDSEFGRTVGGHHYWVSRR